MYSNPTLFQTRGPKIQKWMLQLFVHGELIFYLILMGFFVNSLGKSLSEKCIALLCSYYLFYRKGAIKEYNFNFFIFHPILKQFLC